jgi:hypothetical protein
VKKFEMVSEFEVEDVPILSDVIVPGIKHFELASMAVPVTVKVADGDGDVTSQICVINPEQTMTIFEDGVELTIKISGFMKHANLDHLKMADICCNQLVIDEAQHQWLFV